MKYQPVRPRSFVIFLFFMASSVDPSSQASHAAIFTPLGDLPGGNFDSQANDISADGRVIVGSSSSENGSEAFRWSLSDGIVGLGDIPGTNGVFSSSALAVSSDGSVIVGAGRGSSTSTAFAPRKAFRWTASDGMVSLGNMEATGVSADGSVVVGNEGLLNNFDQEAFHWTSETGMNVIAPSRSFAEGITGDGSTVVGWTNQTGEISLNRVVGFRWKQSEGIEFLSINAIPRAVSADGSVLVGSTTGSSQRPVWWDQNGDLHFLVRNGTRGRGLDVSGDGSVIVGQSNDFDGAFIWDMDQGMRSLKSLLEDEHDLDLTDWSLTTATGISDNGLTIIGNGINPSGHPEAWIANLSSVPEPTTLGTLVAGSLAILRRRVA